VLQIRDGAEAAPRVPGETNQLSMVGLAPQIDDAGELRMVGAEGEVPLEDPTPLDTVSEVELGTPILEAVDGALLGFVDDSVDGLATLEPGALAADDVCEPTELPDGAEGEVPLDEPTPLDKVLDEPTSTELAFWLDAGEAGLLPTCDDNPEPLPGLAELICESWDALDAALGEVPELPDGTSLLPPLADGTELVPDSLGLVLLARLGDRDDAPLGAEELPMELAPLEGFSELGCVDSPELVVDGGDDGMLDAPELESIELAGDGVCDDCWLSRLEAWLDGSDDMPEPDDPDASDGALEVPLDPDDPLRSDEPPESLDWLSDEVDWLDGLADESGADDPDEGERELRDGADSLLSEDDGVEDCRDEPALFEPDDADGELPDGDEPLSDLLD
jgi:hypothetical protein